MVAGSSRVGEVLAVTCERAGDGRCLFPAAQGDVIRRAASPNVLATLRLPEGLGLEWVNAAVEALQTYLPEDGNLLLGGVPTSLPELRIVIVSFLDVAP